MLISPTAHRESLRRMNVPVDEPFNAGSFSEGQRRYLNYHRNNVFLEAQSKLMGGEMGRSCLGRSAAI
ncbi:MAG: hypothetical protein U5K76_16085 [Woeseiaceae bacterium]|nr:hypothetical protein [Woeseiaceae bacterium]